MIDVVVRFMHSLISEHERPEFYANLAILIADAMSYIDDDGAVWLDPDVDVRIVAIPFETITTWSRVQLHLAISGSDVPERALDMAERIKRITDDLEELLDHDEVQAAVAFIPASTYPSQQSS